VHPVQPGTQSLGRINGPAVMEATLSCATKYRVNASDPEIVLALAASGMFGSVVATVDVVEDGAVVAEVDVEAPDVGGRGLEVVLDPEAAVDVAAGVVDAVGAPGESWCSPPAGPRRAQQSPPSFRSSPARLPPPSPAPRPPEARTTPKRADGALIRKSRATKYPSPAVSGKSPLHRAPAQWDPGSQGTRERPAP